MKFWTNIVNFFKNGVQMPVNEPVLPVMNIPFGNTMISLHTDGRITGDMKALEKYLTTTAVERFAEERILFWLLLQAMRAQRQAVPVGTVKVVNTPPIMSTSNVVQEVTNAMPTMEKVAMKKDVTVTVEKGKAPNTFKTTVRTVKEDPKEEDIFKFL